MLGTHNLGRFQQAAISPARFTPRRITSESYLQGWIHRFISLQVSESKFFEQCDIGLNLRRLNLAGAKVECGIVHVRELPFIEIAWMRSKGTFSILVVCIAAPSLFCGRW
jgi:hypothetical protein